MSLLQAQWDLHRKVLERLYLRDDKPLPAVINYMKENHGFQASKAQYELQFKKWNLRKNLNKSEWEFVHHRIEKREREGKESETYFNNTLIPSKKIKKETSRHVPPTFQQSYASAPSPQTPEGISICTPNAMTTVVHPNLLENLPWLQFLDFFDTQVSIGLVQDRPTALGNYVPPKALFSLLPGSATLSLTGDKSEIATKMLPQFQATFFERYDGELMRSIQNTLEPNSGAALTQLLKFAVYLVSNNLSTDLEKDNFVQWIVEHGHQSTLRSFLAVNIPIIDAFAQNIFLNALKIGDVQLVQILVDAGVPLNRSISYQGTPLCIAVKQGNIALIRALLVGRANLNEQIRQGEHLALHQAVRDCRVDIVQLLLNFGANVNGHGSYGWNPLLHEAVGSSGCIEIVQLLLASGSDVNERSKDGATALHEAAKYDRTEIISLLLSFRANLEDETADGKTALHEAAYHRNIDAVRVLLMSGANVNAEARDGTTALHQAARSNRFDIASLLISSGSNINAKARDGTTALHQAARFNRFDIASLLISSGSNINAKARDGTTALQASIDHGNVELIQLLSNTNAHFAIIINEKFRLRQLRSAVLREDENMVKDLLRLGVGVNEDTDDRESLLEIAVEKINVQITRLLLKAGANVNGSDKQDRSCRVSPLGQAVRNLVDMRDRFDDSPSEIIDSEVSECLEILRLLLNSGVEMNDLSHLRPDCDCMTPFQEAVASSNLELVKLLLVNGADVNEPAADIGGRTALQYALENRERPGNSELIKLLLDSDADIGAPAAYEDGITAIHAAAKFEDIEIMELLLRAGGNVNTPAECCENGRTALQAAVEYSHVELTEYLLSMGADANAAGSCKDGITALHAAVTAEDHTLILTSLLLKAGANIDARDNKKRDTVLQAAVKEGHTDVVQLLLKHGANVNAPAFQKYERTALQSAVFASAYTGNTDLVKLLLDAGANVNAPDCHNDGITALQAAASASTGNADLVKLLLNAGANVNANAAPYGGLTALQGAAIEGHLGIAILLLESGAHVNAPVARHWGRTALEGAAEYGRMDMIRLLLNAGADSAKPEKTRYSSAIKLAEKNGQYAAADFLRGFLK